MKLFYSSGSCSLASHIALEQSGAKFSTQRLDLRAGDNRKPEYLAVNPKGRVPTLVLDDGGGVLTENPAIIAHVADNNPASNLLPTPGSLPRAHAAEWLAWCASDVHKSFSPLFAPTKYVDGEAAQKSFVEKSRATVQGLLDAYDAGLANKRFVLGDTFSGADGYTLVFALWGKRLGFKLGPHHVASARALIELPGVQRALATQEVTLEL